MDTISFYNQLCEEEKKLTETIAAVQLLKQRYASDNPTNKDRNQTVLPLKHDDNIKRKSAGDFLLNRIEEKNKKGINPSTDDLVGDWAQYRNVSKKAGRSTVYSELSFLKKDGFITAEPNPNGQGSIHKLKQTQTA